MIDERIITKGIIKTTLFEKSLRIGGGMPGGGNGYPFIVVQEKAVNIL